MILEYFSLGKGPFTGHWGKLEKFLPSTSKVYHLLLENITKLVSLEQSGHHHYHLIECNFLSPLYSRKIAHLTPKIIIHSRIVVHL